MILPNVEAVYLSGPDEEGMRLAEIVYPNGSVAVLEGVGATALSKMLAVGDLAYRVGDEAVQALEEHGSNIIFTEEQAA